jgi:trehalose-phosphatase
MTATTNSLFDRLSEVAAELDAARTIYLFLDFDGTLAPIVEDPEAASMPAETRSILAALSVKPRFRVVVISGRPLADLRRRVGLQGLIYAGNHGIEIDGLGLRFTEPDSLARTPVLKDLARKLEVRLRNASGARIEDKGMTLSVHYRMASDARRAEIRRVVEESVESAGDLFRVTEGIELLEIRPRVNWNKGTAALWILASSGSAGALAVVLGDDATDEDVFSTLPAGITVRIGRTTQTAARYQLEYQEGVGEFLAWLAALPDGEER